MSFWAQKLGALPPAPPAPAPTVAPQQPQSTPWWAQPAYQAPVPTQPAPVAPVAPQQASQPPSQARSARETGMCPDCGSENYFSRRQDGNGLKQCYECGYNDRFTHSTHGSGLPGGAKGGPSTPARQTASGGAGGKSNFQPGTIIGHI